MSQENVEAFKRVVEAANRGRMHARGLESGVETESHWAFLIQFKNGKAIWVRAFSIPAKPSKPPGCGSSGVAIALDEKRRFAWKAALSGARDPAWAMSQENV